MGIGPFRSHCFTSEYTSNPKAPIPNPDPNHWTLLEFFEYKNAFVIKVKYHDCTNFEGVKVMVYKGSCTDLPMLPKLLDPHFAEFGFSPIARFRPDEEGLELAKQLAMTI